MNLKPLALMALGALGLLLTPQRGHSQQAVSLCVDLTNTASGVTVHSCQPVTAANPLPVTGGGSFSWPGSAAVTAYGTAPSGTVPAVNAYITGGVSTTNVALQGAQDATAAPWQMVLYQGGTAIGSTNGLYVQPGTSALFAVTQNTSPWVMDWTTGSQAHADMTAPLPAQASHTVDVGMVDQYSAYPAGAVPITNSPSNGTTGAITATLTPVSGHTAYICGYSVRANATAAVTGNIVVSGTISGSLNFLQWTAPLASGLGVSEQIFSPCVPASAVTTNIVVTTAAPGTGGAISASAWGYSL